MRNRELRLKIDNLIQLLSDLSGATIIEKNSHQDTSADLALEKAKISFDELFNQKTAIYEQIVMNPTRIELVNNISQGTRDSFNYLSFFQEEKTKLFALINESNKADGHLDNSYEATDRLEYLTRQMEIVLLIWRLKRIKERFEIYHNNLKKRQVLLLEELTNFVNQEFPAEIDMKIPLKTMESQPVQVPSENFPGRSKENPILVDLLETFPTEISITIQGERLFEEEVEVKADTRSFLANLIN